MKKVFYQAALLILLSGCAGSVMDPVEVVSDEGFSIVGLCSDDVTRTSFGTPGNGVIPFNWSAGDCVFAGSQKSQPLAGGGSASASFTFNTGSSSDGTDIFYNMTGKTAEEAHVLSLQKTDGLSNLGSNGDFAYTTLSGLSFTLEHFTSYIWLNPYWAEGSSDARVKAVTVTADAYIAGKADFDKESKTFGEIRSGSKSVSIKFDDAKSLSTSDASEIWAAAVILPANVSTLEISYYFDDATVAVVKKEFDSPQSLMHGKTYRISTGLKESERMNVLTFEDADYKGSGSSWSDMIDNPQYGGNLLYGSTGMGFDNIDDAYMWYDEGNTLLYSRLSEGWGSWCYWSGGHAVSNYVTSDIASNGSYESQLTIFYANAGSRSNSEGGHNGSDNFCVHYGYSDNSGWALTEEALPFVAFKDGNARTIDHLYVTNTTYALNVFLNGNGLSPAIGDDDWVKIVATGYSADNVRGKTAEFYLCKGKNINNGDAYVVTDWTKWDISSLGAVAKVTFNITGSSDNGYGFSQPAFFAYDDLAVRKAAVISGAGSSEIIEL